MDRFIFALRDNKIVHVDEVENGLRCNSVCPVCKEPLEACHGEKNTHHFRHSNNPNLCPNYKEVVLFRLACEILSEDKKILVPGVMENDKNIKNPIVYMNEDTLSFDKVYFNKTVNNKVKCDVLCNIGNSYVNIEIKINQSIDEGKIATLKQLKLNTLEIDLFSFYNDIWNYNFKSNLKETIIKNVRFKKWIVFIPTMAMIKKAYYSLEEKLNNQELHFQNRIKLLNLKLKAYEYNYVENEVGKCLICNSKIIEDTEEKLFFCINKNCNVVIPKSAYGIPIGKELLNTLLVGRQTQLIKGLTVNGKQVDGKLVYDRVNHIVKIVQ